MNTIKPDSGLSQRKTAHIEICTQPGWDLESGKTGFDHVKFRHQALPETSWDHLGLETQFLGRTVRLPLLISSMTGGSEEGYRLNKELAMAAQSARIPLGMGSMRVLFHHPEVLEHFRLRHLAPDVPIFANLGVQELVHEEKRDLFKTLFEWTKKLEVDALALHLNPGQELFQEGGERDFRGHRSLLKRFFAAARLPVIVKETGFGIHPEEARFLLNSGASWIDVAGSGGTNWLSVEAFRGQSWEQSAAQGFKDWGWPTALATAAIARRKDVPLIASGGIRSGVDLAKALALGARLGGMALPLIRAARNGGREVVLEVIASVEKALKTSMLLSGASDITQLRHVPLDFSLEFEHQLKSFKRPFRKW
ncbi:MAG: type 2 isopentenyl-diphosphate Delta-isomerase [Spirochaetales bacterium]|nr:type 2 isopentenyl-diphosphate Delta-isomerase [Spirochaetales bacterium]